MDAIGISGIIMNSDSRDSNLDDFDSQTSDLETDSDDDTIQAASPAQVPTSQARTAKQQYIE